MGEEQFDASPPVRNPGLRNVQGEHGLWWGGIPKAVFGIGFFVFRLRPSFCCGTSRLLGNQWGAWPSGSFLIHAAIGAKPDLQERERGEWGPRREPRRAPPDGDSMAASRWPSGKVTRALTLHIGIADFTSKRPAAGVALACEFLKDLQVNTPGRDASKRAYSGRFGHPKQRTIKLRGLGFLSLCRGR